MVADLDLESGFTTSCGIQDKFIFGKSQEDKSSPGKRDEHYSSRSTSRLLYLSSIFFLLILPNVIKGNFKAWSINPYQHYLKEQTSISQAVPILLYAKYLHTLPHIPFATYRTHRSHQTPFSEKAGAWLESVPRYTKAWWSKAFCKQEKRNQKTQHNHITLVPTLIYLLPEFHICSSNNYYSGTRDNVS